MYRLILCVTAALLTFGPAAPSAAADDRSDCASGKEAAERIAACDRLIQRNPNDADAYYRRGRAWYLAKDADREIADYGQAVRLDPRLADAWRSRGDAYSLRRRDYDRAIADYDRAIALNPKDATAYSFRGSAYGQKGDYDRAIADQDQAIRLDPAYGNAYYSRGNAYRARGEYDRAIADYDTAIRLDPSASAYSVRGNAYADKGDYDRAIADFDLAVRLDPKNAAAYSFRGFAYGQKGDFDRAIADQNEALRVDPAYGDAYYCRGNAWQGKGEYDRAIADYDEAIRLEPNAAAYSARGNAYAQKRDFDRAVADHDEAVRRDPGSAYTYCSRGNAHRGRGDYDRAIADYDQAIRLDPRDADAFIGRGEAYAEKGDSDRAILNYSQAIALDPKRPDAWHGRGNAWRRRGENDRAIADYDEALKLDPTFAAVRDSRERAANALAPLQPPSAAIPAERRVALVVGNAAYSAVPHLRNPGRDAAAIADALRDAGFETVTLVNDAGLAEMRVALRSFRAAAASADWALVYYAGHGLQIGRTNYLVPVDARLADERDVAAETVSYAEIERAVGGAKALRIIVLDACRVDPFRGRMARLNPGRVAAPRGLGAPEPEPGTLVVYSAKDGQVAEDGDGDNSPFATALMARLRSPGREVRRMFDDVRDDVLRATNNRQQPFTYGSLPGRRDFFFVAGRALADAGRAIRPGLSLAERALALTRSAAGVASLDGQRTLERLKEAARQHGGSQTAAAAMPAAASAGGAPAESRETDLTPVPVFIASVTGIPEAQGQLIIKSIQHKLELRMAARGLRPIERNDASSAVGMYGSVRVGHVTATKDIALVTWKFVYPDGLTYAPEPQRLEFSRWPWSNTWIQALSARTDEVGEYAVANLMKELR